MKTVINGVNMWNASINAEGKIEVKLNGTDKKFSGTLTIEEQEQLSFRVAALSQGVISFDPEPQDLVGRHGSDVLTLGEQSEKIEALKVENESNIKAFKSLAEEFEAFKTEHADVDIALAKLRDEKKHLTLDLHEANGKILALEQAAMKPVEAPAKSETITQ